MIDLVALAAQADNQRGRNIRVHQHAAERAPQLIHVGTEGVPAAFAVGKRDDAIDIGRQRLAIVAARDQVRRVRRAIAGRHHGDVVTRAHAAILARVAEERGGIRACCRHGRFRSREFVVEHQFLEGEVVGVDVASGLDGNLGAADHLPVALHGFAGGDVPQRDLVAGGDGVGRAHRDAVHAKLGAGGQGHAGDRDVVGGVQVDGGVLGVGDFGDFDQHRGYLSRFSSPLGTSA